LAKSQLLGPQDLYCNALGHLLALVLQGSITGPSSLACWGDPAESPASKQQSNLLYAANFQLAAHFGKNRGEALFTVLIFFCQQVPIKASPCQSLNGYGIWSMLTGCGVA